MKLQLIYLAYFASTVLFIVGLRGLTKPDAARRGIILAGVGMLVAIVGTLLHRDIITYQWIIVGLIVGTIIGIPMGLWIPMTKMPERIALSHAFGGLAVALVGVAEYIRHAVMAGHITQFTMGALGFEVFFGTVTFTGSLMAFGKLQGILSGRPQTFKGQNTLTLALLAACLGFVVWLIFSPYLSGLFYTVVGVGLLLGILLVVPIGGADMPVVICLMNSYAGLAASASGFALDNNILIICGALDGGSGFLLAMIMSKAMNRSFGNVLFGAFGQVEQTSAATGGSKPVKSFTVEDAAEFLKQASSVVIVPGYGMAVAQAQHAVGELQEILEKKGVEVRYAIHPVAGRMPGHMNVLLAEASVPYDHLIEMDAINPSMPTVDVCMVIGANDVVNPAARTDKSSAIYGMPIIDADRSKMVFVLKRSMAAGFAGIDNPLFYLENTRMVFGDAKNTIHALNAELKK
ncbi:MAG: NAD(P)(+) transhydrogenase (Re/Si-specific) subunit beta [Deltaproteobacteria bacterium]|nr:NAD(P)(+) transhydrogenase (Re/Si-specific) subunit beta [Deltaproteobacteria bacterium]